MISERTVGDEDEGVLITFHDLTSSLVRYKCFKRYFRTEHPLPQTKVKIKVYKGFMIKVSFLYFLLLDHSFMF